MSHSCLTRRDTAAEHLEWFAKPLVHEPHKMLWLSIEPLASQRTVYENPIQRATDAGISLKQEGKMLPRVPKTEEELQEDLRVAQWTILSLMPKRIREILNGSCRTWDEAALWEGKTAARIVEFLDFTLEGKVKGNHRPNTRRTPCPLCGERPDTSDGRRGFVLPDGLLRHLLGTHSSRQCRVFAIAATCAAQSAERWDREIAEAAQQAPS